MTSLEQRAREVVLALRTANFYLTGAESVTCGLVSAALGSVSGASEVFLGSFVTYSNEFKISAIGVSGSLIHRQGAVDPEVAAQMALSARRQAARFAGVGEERIVSFSTTGVAGPGMADGKNPGTVFVAVAADFGCVVKQLELQGERNEVREEAASQVLGLILEQYSS